MIIKRTVKLLYNAEPVEKHLEFKEISYDDAKEIIINNHYSKKWNTSFGKINVGVFEKGILLGVASYGNLMNPKSYKQFNKDFEQDSVIELNRLWIDDSLGGNAETILMSSSFRIIREKYPYIKAVQSFADGRLGCGTIYKAMNFQYFGYTESTFYEDQNRLTHHQVPMSNTARPNGIIKLNAQWVQGQLRPFKVKTYKYVYPLYRNVKLDMKQEEYPEYDKGLEYLDDYIHNPLVVARAYILATMLDYPEKEILKGHNSLEDIQSQMQNKTIIRIANQRKVVDKYNEMAEKVGVDRI